MGDRVAKLVGAGEGDRAFHECVIQRFMDIDALDAAAGLAGIEEGSVDQALDRMTEIASALT